MAINDLNDLFSPEREEWLYKQFEAHLSERPQQLKEQVTHARREIAGLDKKINNIVTAIEDGRASSTLLERLNQFEEHREILRSQLHECEAKEENPISIEDVILQLKKAKEKLNSGDPKEIKKVCQTFIEVVEIDDESITVRLKITPPSGPKGGSYPSGSPKALPIVYETYHKRERYKKPPA